MSIKSVVDLINKKLPEDREVKQVLIKTDADIKKSVQEIKKVLSRYRRLSTLGFLIDVILHEGSGILLRMGNSISLLEKKSFDHKSLDHLKNLKNETKILYKLFERLEPFGGRRREKPKTLILEDAIKNVFELLKTKISDLGVEIKLPESQTEIVFDESDLQSIFVNLLENSLYWLNDPNQKERKILVEVEKKENDVMIVFSDNGPGVEEEYRERIYEPYFTRKPDGIGLGLTIVGELVAEQNGVLQLIDGDLDGATFEIIFRRNE